MGSFIICTHHHISSGRSKKGERWVGHVACIGARKVYEVLVGKPEGKNHSEDQDVDGRMGLEWTLDWLGVCGVDPPGSGQGLVVNPVNMVTKFRVQAPQY
jgi:hypothetical protein